MNIRLFSLRTIPIVLGLIFLLLAICLQLTDIPAIKGWVNQFNNIAYDIQLKATLRDATIDKQLPIAIVDIDDKSLKEQGRWPWPRVKMAQLVKQLFDMGATVVALDAIFPEPESNIADEIITRLKQQVPINQQAIKSVNALQSTYNHDQAFANSLALGDSVLGITLHNDQHAMQGALPKPLLILSADNKLAITQRAYYLGNLPLLQNAAKSGGFINAFPDNDGVIRHAQLIIRKHNEIYPSLGLEAARLYLLAQSVNLISVKQGKKQVLEGIKFDQQIIPTDAKGRVLIPFRGPQGSFPYLPATDILNNKIAADEVKNKVIFIGATASGLGDLHAAAVQSVYAGVEIHANVVAGIIQNHFPYRPAWAEGAELSVLILIGLLFAFIFPYLGPGLLLIITVIANLAIFIFDGWLWKRYSIVLSIFIPMCLISSLAIINLSYGYLIVGRRKELLKAMFGQYVPAEHVKQMMRQKGSYGFLGETREMSILFADIRNFTTISEKMEATKLKEMLNQFLTPMTEIIFNHSGTIDKYVGDMIMAFWGAPLHDARHAQHAINAAIDMQIAIDKMTDEFKTRYGADIKMGIGINTGHVSVGDMGSKFRRAYTVIGDNVNLASRLEGLSKFYGVGIVVGENTRNYCQEHFIFRLLDRVKVKGKDIGVQVYEPICANEKVTDAILVELSRYHQALDYYYAQQWQEAEQLLVALSDAQPNTQIYKLYLSRINNLKENPPGTDWNGVYVSKTK